MADHKASRKELEQEVKRKNLELLGSDKGIFDLMVYNHENFAYRYLETSQTNNIKCEFNEKKYWTQSIEPDVFTALKWKHPQLKPVLIDLCKNYPGKSSSMIQIKLELSTEFQNESEVICRASLNWDFPKFVDTQKEIFKSEVLKFSDLLELRNNHAAVLERVSSLF